MLSCNKQMQACGRSCALRPHLVKPLVRQHLVTVAKFSSNERSAKKAQEENLNNAQRALTDGNSRRTLLAVGGLAAVLTAAKLLSGGGKPKTKQPEAVMQVAMNSKLSDNPVANDAVKVLEDAKAKDLAQNVSNTRTKEVSAVGIQRMEVPQGRVTPRNPNRLEGNETFGAATLRNASRPETDRNPVQRFMDSTNTNIKENVIEGSRPPFSK